jgi:hypothetical protein
MNHILNLLMQWIPQCTAVLAFFNPERCKMLIGIINETIDYSKDLAGANSWDEIYPASLEYACDSYDQLDGVAHFSEHVDSFIKDTVFPVVLGFIFGGNK